MAVPGDKKAETNWCSMYMESIFRGDMTLTLAEALQGLQVLVVDSHQDSCELLCFALELSQMQVRTARSVRQAIVAVMQAQPDILITELVLPLEDGYALLRQLRQLEPVRGSRALAIAMTGDIMQSETQALAAGFTKLLWKPVDIMGLATLLAELIREEEGIMCGCCG